jgi:hypothetical protein
VKYGHNPERLNICSVSQQGRAVGVMATVGLEVGCMRTYKMVNKDTRGMSNKYITNVESNQQPYLAYSGKQNDTIMPLGLILLFLLNNT